MDKNLFFVVQREKEGRCFAYAEKVPGNYNLLPWMQGIPYVRIIQAAPTWKRAQEMAEDWNQSYRENGTFDYVL